MLGLQRRIVSLSVLHSLWDLSSQKYAQSKMERVQDFGVGSGKCLEQSFSGQCKLGKNEVYLRTILCEGSFRESKTVFGNITVQKRALELSIYEGSLVPTLGYLLLMDHPMLFREGRTPTVFYSTKAEGHRKHSEGEVESTSAPHLLRLQMGH